MSVEASYQGEQKVSTCTHWRSLFLYAALFLLPTGVSLKAQRVEPDGIRGARRPHSELPSGNTSHAAGVVDAYFDAYWKRSGVSPAPVIDDAAFLRRASLALHGVPASAENVRRFLSDRAHDKRTALVDTLLVHSRYADYWGFRLRSWITEMREMLGQSTNLATLYFYTREAMAENRSWSEIATDLIAREGEVTYRGYTNFSLYFDCEANEVAEAASRLFLGVNLSCAQCHDHPHVKEFSQESYWGFAAYFAKIYIGFGKGSYEKRFPDMPRNPVGISSLPGGDWSVDGVWGDDRGVLEDLKREVKLPDPDNPRTMQPIPLGGEVIENADLQEATRRYQLVAWLTNGANPYFARAVVNRFWSELTGLGFVDKVDGFAPQTAVRHRELLDELARGFNEHQQDLKWLIRTIVLSRIFQLEGPRETPPPEAPSRETPSRETPSPETPSPETPSPETPSPETWATLPRRPLNADQWHDSILRVTGEEARLYSLAGEIDALLEEEHRQRVLAYENAVALTTAIEEQGAGTDGRNAGDATTLERASAKDKDDSSERKNLDELRAQYKAIGNRLRQTRGVLRTAVSPTNEALLMMNGELVATSLREGLAPVQIANLPSAEERLDTLYLTTLGRLPVEAECRRLQEAVREPTPETIADLMWALLQSTEFLTY